MFSSKKLMGAFGILIIASMVLAACGGQPVVETVIVTEIVEIEGEEVVVEKIITATPPPETEEPPSMEGPFMAEGLVPCNDIPELAFNSSSTQMVSLKSPVQIASVPQALPAKPVLAPAQQAGDVYKVGVFSDVTTMNYWAGNGPDNTVWNAYMYSYRLLMYDQSGKYFTLVPTVATVMSRSVPATL